VTPGTLLLAVALLALAPGAVMSQQQTGRRPRPGAAAGVDGALLRQLADAQRALGDQMQQLRESIDALQAEVASLRDADAGTLKEIQAAREEIKGLYVESSTNKQAIEAVREDVRGVDANVLRFRTFSGFFIAAMILLLVVIFTMTVRR